MFACVPRGHGPHDLDFGGLSDDGYGIRLPRTRTSPIYQPVRFEEFGSRNIRNVTVHVGSSRPADEPARTWCVPTVFLRTVPCEPRSILGDPLNLMTLETVRQYRTGYSTIFGEARRQTEGGGDRRERCPDLVGRWIDRSSRVCPFVR